MHYMLNGGNCYIEKGIREGRFGKTRYCQLWLICSHSYWQGAEQDEEFKVSLRTDISVLVVIPALAMWRQRIISPRLALAAVCNFCTRGLDDF